MKNRWWNPVCFLLPVFIVLSGCATIMNGDMVLVPVETTPSPANLTVNGQQYNSPATVHVPRGKGDFVLHVEKDGYRPVDITLTQSLDGWLWGNVLFGGLIGVAVDFISGDAYDLDPEVVRVGLEGNAISYDKSKGLHIVLIDMAQLKPEQQAAIRAYARAN